MPANIARWPVRANAVSGPDESMKFEHGVPSFLDWKHEEIDSLYWFAVCFRTYAPDDTAGKDTVCNADRQE